MKKYFIGQITGRLAGKINKKGDKRLYEALSDNDIIQLFESMGRYIYKNGKTPNGNFTIIKQSGGKQTIISFELLDNHHTDTTTPEQSE